MEKIKNIEMLRFLFSLSIVCVHFRTYILKPFLSDIHLYKSLYQNFIWAQYALDFFFIIAGFFLFLKTNFLQNFYDFAKKKFLRFFPLVAYMMVLYFVASLFTPIKFLGLDNIFTLLNLQNCGLTLQYGNDGALWFLSALFWGMSFYFYLFKIIDKKWFNLITACIVFFSYVILLHHPGKNVTNIWYVINIGMLKALGGLGLGYFVCQVYQDKLLSLKKSLFTLPQQIFCSISELVLFGFVIMCLFYQRTGYDNFMILIVSFIGLFLLFLTNKEFLSRLLNNDLAIFLGQFSFSIFVSHSLVLQLWRAVLYPKQCEWIINHPILNLLAVWLIVFIFGIAAYYIVEKPAAKYLKKKI